MNNSDKNWNHLFGEYTTDETAWHGDWTVYSAYQEVISSKQAVRSFRSNSDNTVITHFNRSIDGNGNAEEKTWQIDRAACNQPDGVIHPAMPFMRALSFGEGATAWIVPKFVPGKLFGAEFFFRDNNYRTSAAIVYGENSQIDRIVHIRESLGSFSELFTGVESSNIWEDWVGHQRTMTPDLSISPEEKIQLSFRVGDHKIMLFPRDLMLMLPKQVTADQPIQLAAAQRTADNQLKYFAAHYTAIGVFKSLISATLQPKSQSQLLV